MNAASCAKPRTSRASESHDAVRVHGDDLQDLLKTQTSRSAAERQCGGEDVGGGKRMSTYACACHSGNLLPSALSTMSCRPPMQYSMTM